MAAAVMTNLNSQQRDEFLKALEEARRAAMAGRDDWEAPRGPTRAALGSIDFRQTLDRIAGTLRSYISAGLVAGFYADGAQSRWRSTTAARTAAAPKSEHDEILDELHLNPNLSSRDLKLIRRRFAMANHPDRVAPAVREQATRRMTIANVLIDDALRGTKARP